MFFEELIGGYVLSTKDPAKAVEMLSREGFISSLDYRDFVLARDDGGQLYFLPRRSAEEQHFEIA